jgi:outer membrane protein
MKGLVLGLALGVTLFSTQASAQFQNKSLGLEIGYLAPLKVCSTCVAFGVPFGLSFTYYLENHFDMVFEGDAIIASQNQPLTGSGQSNIWGFKVVPIGVRYLFMEETFRPYAGLDTSFVYFFANKNLDAQGLALPSFGTSNSSVFLGLGPNAGFDYFLTESVSVGVKARFCVYLALDFTATTTFDATARVATYF